MCVCSCLVILVADMFQVYIRDSTMVSVYSLLLFGGGAISIDLDRGNFLLSVDDGWIRFMVSSHDVSTRTSFKHLVGQYSMHATTFT